MRKRKRYKGRFVGEGKGSKNIVEYGKKYYKKK